VSALVIALLLVIIKTTAVAVVALAVDAQLGRRSLYRSRGFAVLPCVLILLPVLAMLGPSMASPIMSLPHAMVAMPVSPVFPKVSLATLLVGIWLAGALYSLARLLRALNVARRIVRSATLDNSAALCDTTVRAAAAVEFSNPLPRIAYSGALHSPAIIGLRRPTILLPNDAAAWPREELFGVLCHELSHVAQRDWLCHVLEEIAAALYWPNPVVRMLWRRTSLRRELAADRAALAAGASPSDYAMRLIAVARACTREQLAMSLAFGSSQRNDLSIRVEALFAPPPRRSAAVEFLGVALIVATTVLLAASQPIQCVPAKSPTASVLT
jgi:beta-lactamase regulating signal transducer with metallopeptidase domain